MTVLNSRPMPDRIEQLRRLLKSLPPRSAQALSFRLLDGLTREECARAYGISLSAFDVMLLRAARDLAAAEQRAPQEPAIPFAEEQRLASALAATLESPRPAETRAAPAREAALLEELAAAAAPLEAAIRAAERAEEASPGRRRENLIRWALVAAIVLLTAYFYLHGRTRF